MESSANGFRRADVPGEQYEAAQHQDNQEPREEGLVVAVPAPH